MEKQEDQNLSPNQRMFLAGVLSQFELHVLNEDEQEMVKLLLKSGLNSKQAQNYARQILADPKKYGYCEGGCL